MSLGLVCLSQVCLMVGGTLLQFGSMGVPGWCFQLEDGGKIRVPDAESS